MNELKISLRNLLSLDRDAEKKREVIKRTIAFMTLGIDVSRLFSEMIMASASKDHVVKKMIYLYITNYASTNPEVTENELEHPQRRTSGGAGEIHAPECHAPSGYAGPAAPAVVPSGEISDEHLPPPRSCPSSRSTPSRKTAATRTQ